MTTLAIMICAGGILGACLPHYKTMKFWVGLLAAYAMYVAGMINGLAA